MKQYMNESFKHFLHGGDYNPEQWIDTPEIWDEDMRLMQLANCNEMSVGISLGLSWSRKRASMTFLFWMKLLRRLAIMAAR